MDIAPTRPRFRTDLVAQPVDEGGKRFVDVTDPDSGKTFRFYEVEYSIACALDGQRDLDGLLDWTENELGLQSSRDELQTVINTLAVLGYLADESEAVAQPPRIGDGLTPEPDSSSGIALPAPPAGRDSVPGLEATFVAPSLASAESGRTSSPGLPVKAEHSFAGLMDEDEDHVPTTIKKGAQVVGGSGSPELTPAPPADPTALGAAEGSLRPVMRKPDDDDDGPTNLPPPRPPEFDDEMSVDLSDHLHLGPDAVKEAVRQSQLMQVPQALDEPSETRDSTPTITRPAIPTAPAQAGPEPLDEPKAVELPDKPLHISRPVDLAERRNDTRGAPQPKKSRGGLFAILLLVALGGAAAAVYVLDLFEVRARLGLDRTETDPGAAIQQPVVAEPVEDSTPELPTATLQAVDGSGIPVLATSKGVLASAVAAGAEVTDGDVVARLRGTEAIEKRIAEHKDRAAVYQTRVDRALQKKREAESAGDTAEARRQQGEADKAQKKVEEKHQLRMAEEQKLAPFVITTSVAGVVESSLAAGAAVEPDAVVCTIKGPPVLTATFTLPESKDLSKDGEVEVVSTADDKKRLDCKITALEDTSVTVECPSSGALREGDQVALTP